MPRGTPLPENIARISDKGVLTIPKNMHRYLGIDASGGYVQVLKTEGGLKLVPVEMGFKVKRVD